MGTKFVIPVLVSILILGTSGLFDFPTASGHGDVDQVSIAPPSLVHGPPFSPIGQEFVPTASNLVAVDLILAQGGSFPVTINIREGTIDGPLLGSTTKVVVGPVLFLPEHFEFDTPVPLTPGQIHVIHVEGPILGWVGSGDVYPEGRAIQFGEPDASIDFHFTTYFEPPDLSCGAGTIPQGNECVVDPAITQELANANAQIDVLEAALAAALASLETLQDDLDQALLDLENALADLADAVLTITGLEEQVEELGQPGAPVANQGEGQGVPAQGKNNKP